MCFSIWNKQLLQLKKTIAALTLLLGCSVQIQAGDKDAVLSLEGKSFHGLIKAEGWLGLFEGTTTLTFEFGILTTENDSSKESGPYHVKVDDGRVIFTSRMHTDYDNGTIEWKGNYDGESLYNVQADWIRGNGGTFLHGLLLPDVVKWEFTPDPFADQQDDQMILIPGGTFQMGNPNGKAGDDNVPVHTVTVDSFYMDKYEVTVGQFRKFLEETGYEYDWSVWQEYFVSPEDNHPMVNVDWHQASAYSSWAGKRLPTEAEWEYAARGGLKGQRYPWGNYITKNDANFHRYWEEDEEYKTVKIEEIDWKDEWSYSTAPVGSFAPNGYGLFDMAGNVAEWCCDWYQWDYYRISPTHNPQGPVTGTTKVTRGGHWYSWNKGLRVHNRGDNPPDVEWWQDVQGFRLVKDLEAELKE
jgi:formylglycine-generating enzyme required for sulfatase activity